ncbi:MAG: hypothetical protein QXS54_10845 [Candidatus Methanomethylicaceae archaeon]
MGADQTRPYLRVIRTVQFLHEIAPSAFVCFALGFLLPEVHPMAALSVSWGQWMAW